MAGTFNLLSGLVLMACYVGLSHGSSFKCPPCNSSILGRRQQCGSAPSCANGWVPDLCKCCWSCAKERGQFCGGLWHMHGRCDKGLHCDAVSQQLESVLIATVRNGEGSEVTPYLLPNGYCRGAGHSTPCEATTCPSGFKCHHSYHHCGEFPDTFSKSHCRPVPKCIQDNGGCQSQLFFGCDVVNDKCWCGEKTACNGQPPFQYPTRHSCERQFSSSQQESTTRPDIEMTDVLNISGNLRRDLEILKESLGGSMTGNGSSLSTCTLDNGTVVAQGTDWKSSRCSTCTCSSGVIVCDEVWGKNCKAVSEKCRKRELSFDHCCVVCKEAEVEVIDVIDIVEEVTAGKASDPTEIPHDNTIHHRTSVSKEMVWPILLGCVGFAMVATLLGIVYRRYMLQKVDEPRGSFAYSPATAEQQHLHALLKTRNSY